MKRAEGSVLGSKTSTRPTSRVQRRRIVPGLSAPDSLDSVLSVGTTTGTITNTSRLTNRKDFTRLNGRLSASQGSLARHWGSVSSLAPSERSTATFLLRGNGGGKAAPLSKIELTNAIPLSSSARFYLNYSSVRSVLTSDEQLVHCPLHLSHRCNPFLCYHPQLYNSSSASSTTSSGASSTGDQVRTAELKFELLFSSLI